MTLTRIRGKGQLTLPEEIRRAARLQEGDYLEVSTRGGEIIMRPKKLVDAEQAWFWSDGWQAGEREASEDIAAGRTTRSANAGELLKSLNE
jgi:AbrB family looped-hinge helix DNA binding protein